MGPTSRQTLSPASPRPGGARPTSELLGNASMFQTPEAEAIDQWFENLQNYEATLEDMAAASLDVNFKEELSAIEQCSFTFLHVDFHFSALLTSIRVQSFIRGGAHGRSV